MKTIPLVDPWIEPEFGEVVSRQIQSGFIGPGQATSNFATALARYAGVPYCVLTVSGTIALSVAAKALGLGPGDEILVPAYGVVSTINAFAFIGLSPRLVEINRRTGCMDISRLETAIRPQTKAVCYVNFSGYTGPELTQVAALCRSADIPLIEDAACALGHQFAGKAAGSFGSIGIYSFSVPKVLTTGQGGAVLLNSTIHRDAAICAIDQGDTEWRRTNINRGIGSNLRFNDILSAFGLAQLTRLEERLARRRAAHQRMRKILGDRIYTVPGAEAPLHNIVFTPTPNELIAFLHGNGIQAVRQYRALYQHPPYRYLNTDRYDASEYWTERAVYLPFGAAMTIQDAERVAETVQRSSLALDSAA